jgi:ABC-type oligopeptide transport system substrate-binding subunit
MSEGGSEEFILPSLFEGLITLHPTSNEVLAGLSTHYRVNSSFTSFTFYLRGHPKPSGVRLPGAVDYNPPARWSDGRAITADDFVYSWRRAVNPNTAAPLAYLLYCIVNAEEINRGRRPVDALAVRATDDFTLQLELRSSTPYFLELHDSFVFYAVPGHVIERVGSSWTSPLHLVTSGPFHLTEWKPRGIISLRKSVFHYEADSVQLQEIALIPLASSTASVNLYKAGECDWVPGKLLPPVITPSCARKKDFHAAPAFSCMFYAINTRDGPFNDVLIRYALNMATDKRAIAEFVGAGRTPALSVLPSFDGYPRNDALRVNIEGSECDVLKHNPSAARELLTKAGVRSLRIDVHHPNRPATADLPLILQQQWRNTLGAHVFPAAQEEQVWIQSRGALAYKGLSERGWFGDYLDPNTFLEMFLAGQNVSGSGWSDPRYDVMLAHANAETNHRERMRKLAACERFVLEQMPVLPLYYNVLSYLRKPYVRGFDPRRLGLVRFKYVWVDTNWRRS